MKKLFVVGLGPGNASQMTAQARAALEEAQVLCGYTVYTDLAAPLCPGKPVLTTPMRREIDRCRMALERAASGETVAMVCSGDAGVYGMACLVYQLAEEYPPVEIEIVPGVTAALSGAAVLGAPLSHDFCVISLSDLLTPWDLIERRHRAAAQAEFCIALYNTASRRRADYLRRACAVLLEWKAPQTVCGWVRNIGREGQESRLLSLAALQEEQLDMFCTAFVGNGQTQALRGKMVTPRGYEARL